MKWILKQYIAQDRSLVLIGQAWLGKNEALVASHGSSFPERVENEGQPHQRPLSLHSLKPSLPDISNYLIPHAYKAQAFNHHEATS